MLLPGALGVKQAAAASAIYQCAADNWGPGTRPAANGGTVYAPIYSVNQSTGGGKTTTCYMWNGDVSTVAGYASHEVETLQAALNRCYGQSLKVDGKFGWNTEQALKVAQRAENIDVDGKYGPQSRSSLKFSKKYPSQADGGSCGRIKSGYRN